MNSTFSPPPYSEHGQSPNSQRLGHTLSVFARKWFWWIIAAASIIKVIAYFIAPQPLSSFGGHIGDILRNLTVSGIVLAVIAWIACQFAEQKKCVFCVCFAFLFALASLANLPAAVFRRHVNNIAARAAADFDAASIAFEALMKAEENPVQHRKSIISPYQEIASASEKFFKLSYCCTTGYQGEEINIDKAIRLCKMAAVQPMPIISKTHLLSEEEFSILTARQILKGSGIPWETSTSQK